MGNSKVCVISVLFLLCITATVQGRKTRYPNNEFLASSLAANDSGICNTMVEPQGYSCEEHEVTTEDGYILSLQRMPTGRSGKKADKPPVFLQHGIFSDAVSWMLDSPDESLAFVLADYGFDVWIVNSRGTKYSRKHNSLNPNDNAYWDWSWDELASYDLPASVQYVYNLTGQKMHYAGHSQGTLIALAAFSQGKVMNMLRSAALLSPIAYMNQIPSEPTKFAADLFVSDESYWLGLHEYIPNVGVASQFVKQICGNLNMNCQNYMTYFTGPNCCMNSSRTNFYLDHEPQPTSTKNLIHLSQMIRTGNIGMFDYGVELVNFQHYKEAVPPRYDMTKISNEFPLFVGYGGQDALADVKDVQVLINKLKGRDGNKLVQLFKEDYAHLDFILGVNAKQLVYDPMIAFYMSN